MEKWKKINNLMGYEISNYGNIRSYYSKNGKKVLAVTDGNMLIKER